MQDPDSVLEEIGRGLIQIPSPFPLPEGEERKAFALHDFTKSPDYGESTASAKRADERTRPRDPAIPTHGAPRRRRAP